MRLSPPLILTAQYKLSIPALIAVFLKSPYAIPSRKLVDSLMIIVDFELYEIFVEAFLTNLPPSLPGLFRILLRADLLNVVDDLFST